MKRHRGVEITGPVRVIHQYVDMSKATAEVINHKTGEIEIVRFKLLLFFSFSALFT